MILLTAQSLTLLFWQAASQDPSLIKTIFEWIGLIATPIAALGLIVNIIYFLWHSKNREELTKSLAEALSLADTRGKRIQDQKDECAELEKTIIKRDAVVLAKMQEIINLELEIARAEELDEKRAKTEFRLRGEIHELEKRADISIHETGS